MAHQTRNPHDWFTPEQPWRPFHPGLSAPDLPGATPVVKEARERWDVVEGRRAQVAEVEKHKQECVEAAAAAYKVYRAAVDDAASAGDTSTDVILEHERRFKVARDIAESEMHGARLDAASRQVKDAEQRYRSFLEDHWAELLETLRPSAERVTAEYQKALKETRERLAPLEREHERLRNAALMLIGRTPPFTPEDVPADPAEIPLPSRELIARALPEEPEPEQEQLQPAAAAQGGSEG